jgi:hypothetical protein
VALPLNIDPVIAGIVVSSLLGVVGLLYLAMGFGLRWGELVWSGRHVGRLPAEQRWWSFFYALGLLGSAYVLLELTDAVDLGLLPTAWVEASGFVIMSFLGVATLASLFAGSRWERFAFAPVTLAGSLLAAWTIFG